MIRSQFDLLNQVKILQQEDPYCESIRKNEPLLKDFIEKDGVLYFKDRLIIPKKCDLRSLIMKESHQSPYIALIRSTKMREDFKKKNLLQ